MDIIRSLEFSFQCTARSCCLSRSLCVIRGGLYFRSIENGWSQHCTLSGQINFSPEEADSTGTTGHAWFDTEFQKSKNSDSI